MHLLIRMRFALSQKKAVSPNKRDGLFVADSSLVQSGISVPTTGIFPLNPSTNLQFASTHRRNHQQKQYRSLLVFNPILIWRMENHF
jgi:hypothetical protein